MTVRGFGTENCGSPNSGSPVQMALANASDTSVLPSDWKPGGAPFRSLGKDRFKIIESPWIPTSLDKTIPQEKNFLVNKKTCISGDLAVLCLRRWISPHRIRLDCVVVLRVSGSPK
jgi:hypothetical protein